ncbi:MAG: hypothetical protein K0R50_2686 [Eubacterium sp.]|jgi:hypothetical protein|nr:hypothetical protein [Eubacterium sp.]
MKFRMPKFLKYILKTVVFLIIFKLIDVSVGGFLYYHTYFNRPNMHELMWNDFYSYEKNSIDVVFLGSSHARFAFDSAYFDKELNIKTFNLSSSGQTPVVGYFALKEALKYQKPKLLIYETYSRLFGTSDNVTPAYFVFDYIKSYDIKAEMLVNLCMENTFSSFLLESLIKSYKYRDGVEPAFENILSGNLANSSVKAGNLIEFDDFTYYKDGYFGSEKVASQNKLFKTNPFKKAGKNFTWDEKQLEYFKKTINLCKENNIPVLMVTVPMPKPTMDFMKDYDKSYKYLKTTADSMKVDYIDFNLLNRKSGTFTNDMFYDSNHLNTKGTHILDENLAPVIKNYLN